MSARLTRPRAPGERLEPALDHAVTALVGTQDDAYTIATGGGVAMLQRFDAEGNLLWEKAEADCSSWVRLIETDAALVALAQCEKGYVVSWLTSQRAIE